MGAFPDMETPSELLCLRLTIDYKAHGEGELYAP